jgi:hypothetical protein
MFKMAFLVLFGEFWVILKFLRPTDSVWSSGSDEKVLPRLD